MAKWKCNQCNVDMEEADDIELTFGEVDLPPGTGFRCPKCKVEFLESSYVTDELNSAEQMLEGK